MGNHELTDRDFLNALAELFSETDLGTSDEIDTELRDLGYDPESFAKKMEAVAIKSLSQSPYNWRNKGAELEEKRQKLAASVSRAVSQTREEMIAAIQRILDQAGETKLVSAHYRNLEEVTNEDLSSLLAELELLAMEHDQPNNDTDE